LQAFSAEQLQNFDPEQATAMTEDQMQALDPDKRTLVQSKKDIYVEEDPVVGPENGE
jgi:hypothetical protein